MAVASAVQKADEMVEKKDRSLVDQRVARLDHYENNISRIQ